MTRRGRLQPIDEQVDDLLSFVRSNVDELVIVSDHGMHVSWIDETAGKTLNPSPIINHRSRSAPRNGI